MEEPRHTAAVRNLNGEVRELRARLTSATYRADDAEARVQAAEERIRDLVEQLREIPEDTRRMAAELAESRRQVALLLEDRRKVDAMLVAHGPAPESLDAPAVQEALDDLEGRAGLPRSVWVLAEVAAMALAWMEVSRG